VMRMKRLALALFMAVAMSVTTATSVVAQPQQFPEAPFKCEKHPNSPFCGGLPDEEAIEHSCQNPGRNPPHCP
jgi:hypothetical protein